MVNEVLKFETQIFSCFTKLPGLLVPTELIQKWILWYFIVHMQHVLLVPSSKLHFNFFITIINITSTQLRPLAVLLARPTFGGL